MNNLRTERKQAVHPHWTGTIQLCPNGHTVLHEATGNTGVYERSDNAITIHWERYGSESYVEISGVYVHQGILDSAPAIEDLNVVKAGNTAIVANKVSLLLPDCQYEVGLRLGTSDIPTFNQVFMRREYDSPYLPQSADVIVDLGANIGLATIFFGLKYPDARILAVEPGEENFRMLHGNTVALGNRIQKRAGAVWVRDGSVNLHAEDHLGRPLGNWGLQVSEQQSTSRHETVCYKLSTLLDQEGYDRVDILKCDIEGAEYELFSSNPAEWLSKIELIMVETHDRFRPGSDMAVRNALRSMFDELPSSGEELIFRRRDSERITGV